MGLITKFSAYDFENFMQSIKKCVKKPNKILQQIRNHFDEKSIIMKKKSLNYNKRNGKLVTINGSECYLSFCFPNNFCLLKDQSNGYMGTIVKITRMKENIFYSVKVQNPKNFYTLPVPSMQLGIGVVENVEGGEEFKLDIGTVKCKMICLPYNNEYVVIPMLHNCT